MSVPSPILGPHSGLPIFESHLNFRSWRVGMSRKLRQCASSAPSEGYRKEVGAHSLRLHTPSHSLRHTAANANTSKSIRAKSNES